MIKIVSIDDHPMFSYGLKECLQSKNENYSIKNFSIAKSALLYLSENEDIDLILLDLTMPEINGIDFLQALSSRKIDTPVVILTAHEDINLLQKALSYGASGIILKNQHISMISQQVGLAIEGTKVIPDKIKAGINNISKFSNENTQTLLSKRQYEILKMVQAGLTNSGIASVLYISELTVKSHLQTIFKILGAKNRVDCVRKAESLKILNR